MPRSRPPNAPPRPAPRSTREALRQRGPSRRQLSRHQREQRQRRAILGGTAVLLVVVATVLGYGYWRENYGRAGETVATIFGERISAADLAQEVRPRLLAIDRRIAALNASGQSQQAVQLQFQRQQLVQTTLDSTIEDRVIRREAANRGLVVRPEEVDDRLRQNVAQADAFNQPQPTPTVAPTLEPGAS